MSGKLGCRWGGWVRVLVMGVAGLAAAAGAIAQEALEAVEASGVLRQYVEAPDPSYGYTIRHRSQLGPCEVIELTLTSQTWRGLEWKHRLFLLVPSGVEEDTDALLMIEGGSWKSSHANPLKAGEEPYPDEAVLLAAYAQQLRCPIAVLLNVPRQPIFDGRKEDAIIALTFDEYLNTGEKDWPLLLPMTKSAVKAMDAVQAFAGESLGLRIKAFTVTGASKRGWTTWLTAAVDARVKGLAPMVIDMLNMEKQFDHQLMAYGKFSSRISDYTDRNLTQRMSGKPGEPLRQIVDPYSYRKQITQPKLILLGTNDGYWTLDALNLYWDGLVGEKYVIYVPNADHDLNMDWQRIMGGLSGLLRHVDGEQELPDLQWRYEHAEDSSAPGTLTVSPGQGDAQVRVWSATAPTRDFREARWTSRLVPVRDDGQAVIELPDPGDHYAAVYAEASYPRTPLPLHLSTTIRVLKPTSR